jgi:hypothetical protein
MPQYHIAQLARRLAGAYLTPRAEHLKTMCANIEAGRFKEGLDSLKAMDTDMLKKTYQERELEPATAGEDWAPKDSTYL